MTELRTVASVIEKLPPSSEARHLYQLPAPTFDGVKDAGPRVALAVESMRRHTTDEGWQIMAGLQENGYHLSGYQLDGLTDLHEVLRAHHPSTVVVQDKREWDYKTGDFREPQAQFKNVEVLEKRNDVFKVTVLKDSHQRPIYHQTSAHEMGVHAWIIYYHPKIVLHSAPYLRGQHLIRTWHTLDSDLVGPYSSEGRSGCLLSGAVSGVYPLRQRLVNEQHALYKTHYERHPGYHRDGCHTPAFLKQLQQFKVSICTSSIYGYALRKLAESTACGCRVITDLPIDETMPGIDGNLFRIPPEMTTHEIAMLTKHLCDTYDPEVQRDYAERAKLYYDYRNTAAHLAADIEDMRRSYPC